MICFLLTCRIKHYRENKTLQTEVECESGRERDGHSVVLYPKRKPVRTTVDGENEAKDDE